MVAETSNEAAVAKPKIIINDLTLADVGKAMTEGWADMVRGRQFSLFFGVFFMVGGWLILYTLNALNLPFLAFPMATGFALIAPFAAGGLYEISRRLERDEPLSFDAIFASIRTQASRDLGWMALVTTFAFYIWIDLAGIIYLLFFGLNFMEPTEFLRTVFTTSDGLMFLALGNGAGAVLAAIVFSITVISFPLLYDRDVDFVTAMITSVKSVARNPVPMALWCIIIVVLMLASFAVLFVGLVVTLPLLGHGTWHLYRRTISFDPA